MNVLTHCEVLFQTAHTVQTLRLDFKQAINPARPCQIYEG